MDEKSNGIAASALPQSKTITLPLGGIATIREGRGLDLMHAQRAVNGNPDAMALIFSLIAELVQIDGHPVVYEDVLAMKLQDVIAIQAEVVGVNFQLPPPPTSPDSSSSGFQSKN
jgi:hypothetical protein